MESRIGDGVVMFGFRNLLQDEYCAVPGHDPDASLTRAGPATVGAPCPGADAVAQVHSELESPVAFYLKVMESVGPLREWEPEKGRLKALLDQALEAEAVALKGGTASVAQRRHAVQLASDLRLYVRVWNQLPGARSQWMRDHYEHTLAEPLSGPLDMLVQRQLSLAAYYFRRAHEKFLICAPSSAVKEHAEGMAYCRLADGLLACQREGTAAHADLLNKLFEIGLSTGKFKAFKAFIEDESWKCELPAAANVAKSPQKAVIKAIPLATLPAELAGTGKDADVTPRLIELRRLLRPSFLELEKMHMKGAKAIQTLGDPGGRMKMLLDILQNNQPPGGERPKASYVKLLGALEDDVKRAQTSQHLREEVTQAREALEDFLQQVPPLRTFLAYEVWEMEDRFDRSVKAAEQGDLALADRLAHLCLETVTKTLAKAQQWANGHWPKLQDQQLLWRALVKRCQEKEQGPLLVMPERLVERFWVLSKQFQTASNQEQADQALERLQETLKQVDAFNRPSHSEQVATASHPSAVSVATQTDSPIDLPTSTPEL